MICRAKVAVRPPWKAAPKPEVVPSSVELQCRPLIIRLPCVLILACCADILGEARVERGVQLRQVQERRVRTIVLGGSDYRTHAMLGRLQGYPRRRNANARHPHALAAQRREHARIRSQRQQRWGRPQPKAAAA